MAGLSRKEKENQTQAKAKICNHCDKPFEFGHFTQYIFQLRGNTVTCYYCIKESYIVPPKSVSYLLVLLGAFLIALIIGLGLAGGLTASTYNEYDGTVRIIWWVWLIAFLLVGAITRFLSRIAKWKMATVSIDKVDKDYEDIN